MIVNAYNCKIEQKQYPWCISVYVSFNRKMDQEFKQGAKRCWREVGKTQTVLLHKSFVEVSLCFYFNKKLSFKQLKYRMQSHIYDDRNKS